MKKFGALTILTSILLPVMAWCSLQLIEQSKQIVSLETSIKYISKNIQIIREDQRHIKELLMKELE